MEILPSENKKAERQSKDNKISRDSYFTLRPPCYLGEFLKFGKFVLQNSVEMLCMLSILGILLIPGDSLSEQ